MSNSLAVATVTATLKNLLMSAFTSNAVDPLAGANVTTLNPSDRDGKTGANVFLYQVSPNAQLRSLALPSRDAAGATITPPQIALDLHYLISFYGDQTIYEPQRLLGIAVRTLNAQPVLSPGMIAQTVASLATSTTTSMMGQSDLASAIERVRLVEAEISLEEMSKLWSILLQTKYALSVLYVASVVLIDSPESSVTALPVLQANIAVNPMRAVSLDQVVGTDAGTFGGIVSGARVALLGTGLGYPGATVILDGNLDASVVPPAVVSRADGRLEFVLPTTLSAGAHGVELASFPSPGSPSSIGTLPNVESNALTFLLRPQLGTIAKSAVTATSTGIFQGTLTIAVVPPVTSGQAVGLMLNQKSAPPSGQLTSGLTLAPDPSSFAGGTSTSSLTFSFAKVPAGTYAARLRVDGAESPPVLVGTTPPSIGPEIAIP